MELTFYLDKIETIKQYLKIEFADDVIENDSKFNFETELLSFRVIQDYTVRYLLKVSKDFLEDNDQKNIQKYLKQWNVAKEWRSTTEKDMLVITTSGIQNKPRDS